MRDIFYLYHPAFYEKELDRDRKDENNAIGRFTIHRL